MSREFTKSFDEIADKFFSSEKKYQYRNWMGQIATFHEGSASVKPEDIIPNHPDFWNIRIVLESWIMPSLGSDRYQGRFRFICKDADQAVLLKLIL